jgi:metal-dependent amidase/aminoacylase/carboxypeptidase family protein
MTLVDRIVQFHHEIREIRRDIHAHPELRYEEQRTSDLVAGKLEQWDIPVIRGLGRTGVVGTIGNGEGTHRESGHGTGPCMLHNPSYDFNDGLIPVGATYWVRLAERFLAKP